jgi:4-amino-4-deoxy-L-arabinose transferase-like glycosyltransferase
MALEVPAVPRATAIARDRSRWAHLALLLAVALPLLLIELDLPFLDPDEGLYGDVAREMLASGDWVVPSFNGLPYLEKPPLYFWLSTLTLRLDGEGEWALRIWSSLSALGTVLLAWRMGRRLHGPAAGVMAGLILASTAGYALYVRKASTDFVFVFCLTLALYGFVRDAARHDRRPTRFLVFYAGAALALLAKGLIGVAFPVLIVGITLLWTRRLTLADVNLGRGALVFAAIALPWHALVAWRQPGFFWFYIVDNQILRFLDRRAFVEDDVPVTVLAFLVLTFIWFFPWSVFAFARPAQDGHPAAAWRSMMPIWAIVVIGFFAASGSKLEYYALPAFPALAVMVGAAWAGRRDVGRFMVPGLLGCVAVGVAAVWLGARLTPSQAFAGLAELNVYYRILRDQGAPFPFESVRPFARLLQGLGATLIIGWTIAAVCWWRRWPRTAFAALAAEGAVIAALIVALLHVVEPHHSAKPVAQAIVARAGTDDVVAHEGSLEYSAALPFYTGRRIVVVNGTRGDLDLASRLPEASGYFVDAGEFQGLWGGDRRVFLVTQHRRAASIATDLPTESVHLIGCFGSRCLYSNRGN